MTEGIQLSMFMTAEQQQMVDRYIAGQNKDAESRALQAQRQTRILMDAGLRPNVHFKNTFEIKENVTETVTLGGRYYDVEEFETEVTCNKCSGGVFLLYDMVAIENDERKVVKKDTWFTTTSDSKVECSTIVGSYRAVKPETILRKLNEMTDAAKERLKYLNEQDTHFNNAIAEMKAEFPTATSVERQKEWIQLRTYTNSYYADIVRVSFEDGSYIMYDVSGYTGKISIRKVYDIEVETQTIQNKVDNLRDRFTK